MWWLFGLFGLIPLILWGAYLLFLWVFGWMIILIFEGVPNVLVWAWRGAEERQQERARLIQERERWAQGTPRDRVLYEALRRERRQGFLDVYRYKQELEQLDAQDCAEDHIETSEASSRGPGR